MLFAAALYFSGAAHAFKYCDPAEALYKGRENETWAKALDERRFADIERYLGGILASYRDGKLSDAEVDYAFSPFKWAKAARAPLYAEWIAQYPRSEAAHLASAYHQVALAWESRGANYIKDTSRSQLDAMGKALEQAYSALEEYERRSKRPGVVRAKRLEILKMAAPRDAVRKAYAEAIAKDAATVAARAQFIEASAPKWGGSESEMQRALEDAKGLAEADRRYLRASVEFQRGLVAQYEKKDEAKAAEHLQRAVDECPALPYAAEQLVHLYGRLERYAPLVKASSTYLERYPANGWGYTMRAWAYDHLGKTVEAFEDYQRGALYGNKRATYQLGQFHEYGRPPARKDLKKALEYYTIAEQKGELDAKAKVDLLRRTPGTR